MSNISTQRNEATCPTNETGSVTCVTVLLDRFLGN